jgi:hypothetical protein
MILHLELPDTVVSLLGDAPERTIYRLIKAHLAPAPAPAEPRGRPVSNAERDAAIADKAVAGATHATIANEYDLSIVRVSQIAAQGKAAALIRNPKLESSAKAAPIHNAPDKPKRILTQTDIDNLHRMRSESATNAEMMQAFAITIEEVQAALRTAPTPKPVHTTTTPKPAHTTLHGTPLPSHDFEFDMKSITGKL